MNPNINSSCVGRASILKKIPAKIPLFRSWTTTTLLQFIINKQDLVIFLRQTVRLRTYTPSDTARHKFMFGINHVI
jgi:hypothetical protein